MAKNVQKRNKLDDSAFFRTQYTGITEICYFKFLPNYIDENTGRDHRGLHPGGGGYSANILVGVPWHTKKGRMCGQSQKGGLRCGQPEKGGIWNCLCKKSES